MDQSIPESSWQRIDSGKKLNWFKLYMSSLKWQKSSLFQLQTGWVSQLHALFNSMSMRDGVSGEKRDCGRGCESFLESELFIQLDCNLELPISASAGQPVYQVGSSQVQGIIFSICKSPTVCTNTFGNCISAQSDNLGYWVPQEVFLYRHIRKVLAEIEMFQKQHMKS